MPNSDREAGGSGRSDEMDVGQGGGGPFRGGGSVGGRVAAAHRELDRLFERVREAFAGRDRGAVGALFGELREALERHFEQEDRLYYPAIWALRPERKPGLMGFVRAHEGFRGRLAEIAQRLDEGVLEEARAAFEAFAAAFTRHEAGEESALSDLEHELARAAG